ncbi:PQQ-binding-like beta-propeller repeat protein [Halovivax cerinus]|uniref:PQQ-binding-like beta-propeller repeat protein n=1 Tax=Halovivax cerinus TaxID=1487865 RepID=A0ABD5NRU4_9EURY|nr:PQQ-binding-like beta-propeller repeat protein [Halovivax cerinus]
MIIGAGSLFAGCAGAFGMQSHLGEPDADYVPGHAPLAWADTEWPFPDYDPALTRNPPPESAPDADLERVWDVRDDSLYANEWAPPIVANGQVFVAGAESRGVALWAVDIANGDVEWSRKYLGDGGTGPSLAAPGSALYYRIEDWKTPVGAFAAATGERVWNHSDPPNGNWVIGDGRFYHTDTIDGDLHAYDVRTGDHLWVTPVDDERLFVRSFHPEVGVFASGDGTLYALDPANGSVRWDRGVSSHTKSGPVVPDGRVFITKWTDGMDLLSLDPTTGEQQWQYPLSQVHGDTPEGRARRWYEIGAATSAVVVVRERRADSSAGRLHAVEADTGERRWRIAPPSGTAGFGAPTVVGDHVYVSAAGSQRSTVLRLSLDDGARLSSWDLPPGAGDTLVADGLVIVEVADGIVALA